MLRWAWSLMSMLLKEMAIDMWAVVTWNRFLTTFFPSIELKKVHLLCKRYRTFGTNCYKILFCNIELKWHFWGGWKEVGGVRINAMPPINLKIFSLSFPAGFWIPIFSQIKLLQEHVNKVFCLRKWSALSLFE